MSDFIRGNPVLEMGAFRVRLSTLLRRSSVRWVVVLGGAAVVLACSGLRSTSATEPGGGAGVPVYTNRDLGRLPETDRPMYTNRDLETLPKTDLPVSSTPQPPTRSPALPSLATAPRPDRTPPKETIEAIETRLAVEERIEGTRARIEELERRLLSIYNPFVPRPQLPPEEAVAWMGLDGVQRAERVKKQIAAAEHDLMEAEAMLATLRETSES